MYSYEAFLWRLTHTPPHLTMFLHIFTAHIMLPWDEGGRGKLVLFHVTAAQLIILPDFRHLCDHRD